MLNRAVRAAKHGHIQCAVIPRPSIQLQTYVHNSYRSIQLYLEDVPRHHNQLVQVVYPRILRCRGCNQPTPGHPTPLRSGTVSYTPGVTDAQSFDWICSVTRLRSGYGYFCDVFFQKSCHPDQLATVLPSPPGITGEICTHKVKKGGILYIVG